MEHFTIILVSAIMFISIFMFAVWTHKNFLNFLVKVSFLIGALVSIGVALNELGIAAYSAVGLHTYMWINIFYFGLLGFTWSNKGYLNLFLKFCLILTCFGIATWLYIF